MPISIADAYPTLWHYTTAAGLDGILKSQQLWATSVRYLNDDEELRGFFERKLPALLEAGIDDGIQKVLESPRGKEMLKEAGDVAGIRRNLLSGLHESLTTVTLGLEVYVTSFCYTASGADSADGLLSQWRGYGRDGGYALVFETNGLNDLLVREQEEYKHPFLNFSDVDYHYDDWVSDTNRHEETLEWERSVREIVSRVVVDGDLQKQAEELFLPIVAQSIRHKHRGFKEEREVRVAAVRLPKKVIKEAEEIKDAPPNKPVSFYPRSGMLVPYISLFDRIPPGARELPIEEIVVGPHPDKLKRQQAVQMLLDELEIEAKVRISGIPFLGR